MANKLNRSYNALRAEVKKQMTIIYPAVYVALWQNGWRADRLSKVFNEVKNVMDEVIQSGNDKSMIQVLDEETGIEMTLDENGRSWREIVYLNSELWKIHKSRLTSTGVILANNSQRKYVAPNILAAFCVALHRIYGWSHVRLSRLMGQVDQIRMDLGEEPKRYSALLEKETGVKPETLPFTAEGCK